MTNRKFWGTIRPFITNKGIITSNEILLKKGDDIINNEGKVAQLLNYAYINVVGNAPGKKPVNTILEECKYHPSVLNIKKTL